MKSTHFLHINRGGNIRAEEVRATLADNSGDALGDQESQQLLQEAIKEVPRCKVHRPRERGVVAALTAKPLY